MKVVNFADTRPNRFGRVGDVDATSTLLQEGARLGPEKLGQSVKESAYAIP